MADMYAKISIFPQTQLKNPRESIWQDQHNTIISQESVMMSTIHNALLIDWMTFSHLSRRVPLLDKDVRICLNIYAWLRP